MGAAPKAEPEEADSPADKLPDSPSPVPVLARLDGAEWVVTTRVQVYEPRTEALPGGQTRTSYAVVKTFRENRYAADKVKLQTAKGKEIAKADAEKMFRKDRLAVTSMGGGPVDPLHLKLLKDGVPVLVLPGPTPPLALPPAPGMPVPVAPPAVAVPAVDPQAPPAKP